MTSVHEPTADPRVSVAVCTLGHSPHLPATLRALVAQTTISVEVLVIDNAPESGRVARLADSFPSGVRVVAEPRRGLSHARNRALTAASASLVAFTDDDALPEPGWAAAMVAPFDRDSRVQVVTGRVVAAEHDQAEHRWFEQGFSFDKGDQAWVWTWPQAPDADLVAALDARPGPRGLAYPYAGGEHGSGNAIAVRRDRWRAAGGFDPALGAGSLARGGEDLDLFRRCLLDGGALVYRPEAVVRHHHRSSYPALARQCFDYGVGMAASVTVLVVRRPRLLPGVLAVVPRALRLLLDPTSVKNADKAADYPRDLDRRERVGYLLGPLLGLASLIRRGRR